MSDDATLISTLVSLAVGGGGFGLVLRAVNRVVGLWEAEKKAEREERKQIRQEDREDQDREREAREKGITEARTERREEREVRTKEIETITRLSVNVEHALERLDDVLIELRDRTDKHPRSTQPLEDPRRH